MHKQSYYINYIRVHGVQSITEFNYVGMCSFFQSVMLKGKNAIQTNGNSPKTKIRSSPRKSGSTASKSKYTHIYIHLYMYIYI